MKKYLTVAVAFMMVFSLSACNNSTADNTQDSTQNTEQTEEISLTTQELINSIDVSSAEAKGICGTDLTWYYQDNVLVIKGNGEMNNYQLDSAPWNDGEYSINWVIVDEGVTSIGQSAFYRLQDLNKVQLPDTLETIGADAFKMCNNLKEITIPKLVKTTNGGAGLIDCQNLNTVTFEGDMPEGANDIVWRANVVNYSGNTFDELIKECEDGGHIVEWNKK